MNKTTKIILISIGVIGCGVGLWLLFRKKGGNQFPNVNDKSKNEKNTFINNNSSKYTGEGDPLKIYDKGENVKCLQKWLNVKGCQDKNGSGLEVDGYFGPLTESALKGCGYASGQISHNALRSEVTTLLNAGETIDCSSSSCCANITITQNNNGGNGGNGGQTGCDNDWDCDGVPDMIDKDPVPNTNNYNLQYDPYYMPIDNARPGGGLFAFSGPNNEHSPGDFLTDDPGEEQSWDDFMNDVP